MNRFLPGFKASCIIAGSLNMLFFFLMVSEGVMKSMAEFKVPETLLNSPHYQDAMFWVFLHMNTLGIMLILMGLFIENKKNQKWAARVLVLVFCIYLFLDVRTSDNPFGNALYQGEKSVFPVFVDLFYIMLFGRISILSNSDKES